MVDLVEPTKPQNPYWMWLSENRAAIIKEVGGGNVSLVGKVAGEKWKAMSEDAKAKWVKLAEEGKAAYVKALEEFKAQGGVVGKRRQEKKDAKEAKAQKKAKKEARKASGQPTRPPSAYWLWLSDNRSALQKEAGTGGAPAVSKMAGVKWAKMSDVDKGPFEKRAEELKKEYNKQMEEWKAKNAAAPTSAGDQDEEDDEGDDDYDDDEDNDRSPAKKQSPSKKTKLTPPPKKAEAASPPKKAKVVSPPKKSKGRGKGNKTVVPAEPTMSAEILNQADKLGLRIALENLAKRDQIVEKNVDPKQMLDALQKNNGLVNKAKAFLLAGA